MANPKITLTKAFSTSNPSQGIGSIEKLVSRVFTTRNLAHFAHWSTQSYAAHQALGELYDALVEKLDDIVETYQGEFGLLKGLCTEQAEQPPSILDTIKSDSEWLKSNRDSIANGSKTIENMLDDLNGCYNKIIYKLSNLK